MSDVDLYRTQAKSIESVSDLIRLLRPQSDAIPEVVPGMALITAEEKAALDQIREIFGAVSPETKRDLSDEEVAKLYKERSLLDTIDKMCASRKAAIRTIMANAMDCRYEQTPHGVNDEIPDRDGEGHVLQSASISVPETHQKFSWEVSAGRVDVDVQKLLTVSDDPEVEEITHQDYLDVTTPIRVVNPTAFIEKLKQKPEILKHLRAFATQGAAKGALYVRKQK